VRTLGAKIDAFASLEQVHSASVVEARPGPSERADGLWTDRPALALCVVTADCAPLVLTDGSRIAVVHAGWRGVAAEIAPAALSIMCSPSRTHAWIGPTVGSCCYEVGNDVAAHLVDASGATIVNRRNAGKAHVDLVTAIEIQLRTRGVQHVHRVGPCTSCRPDLLWSYRRDGSGTGRNLTVAWLGTA
jgi:YfiH family protein